MNVSGQIHASTALHPWHEPQYRMKKSLGGHQSRSGSFGEENLLVRSAENRTVIPRSLNILRASTLDGSEELASSYSCFYSGQTA